MRLLKIMIFMALILPYAGSVLAAEIVAMRAYEHKEFHRLTIIVSDDITLAADKEDERVVLRMRGLTVKPLKDLPGTEAIKVRTFRQESDLNGDYASLEVSIPPGSKGGARAIAIQRRKKRTVLLIDDFHTQTATAAAATTRTPSSRVTISENDEGAWNG